MLVESPVPSSLLTLDEITHRDESGRVMSGEEAPLERLRRRGSSSLSDAELLSLLLRSGCSQARSLEMAQEVLAGSGLVGLLHWKPPTLLRLKGFGVAKVGTVLALAELVQRMARARMPQRQLMEPRDRVAAYLYSRYHQVDQKVMGALYVDARSRLIEESEHYRGTSYTGVEPRALLKPAFLCGAAGMILFHVHPGDPPAPSADDLDFTRRLKAAAEICGVALHDHLILGSGRRFVSVESFCFPRRKRRILQGHHTPGNSAGTKETPQC